MDAIKFKDACIIKRVIGKGDEYDEPIVEVLYDGECYYQDGGYTTAQQMLMRSPIVFIPQVLTSISPNNIIDVTTSLGRTYSAVIGYVRDIELPITRQRVMKLELKQSKA